jgi:hypothetical protein
VSELKVGDEVWCAESQPREVRITCPVCFGKRAVRVILGDGTVVETLCDYCGRGCEGPHGWTMEYDRNPRAVLRRVTEVRARDTSSGREVQYLVDGGWCPSAEDVFADEASALARARVKAAEMEAADEEGRRRNKDGTVKHLSWTVGYHRREAKEHRRQIEYHESRAVQIAGLVKAEKVQP